LNKSGPSTDPWGTPLVTQITTTGEPQKGLCLLMVSLKLTVLFIKAVVSVQTKGIALSLAVDISRHSRKKKTEQPYMRLLLYSLNL